VSDYTLEKNNESNDSIEKLNNSIKKAVFASFFYAFLCFIVIFTIPTIIFLFSKAENPIQRTLTLLWSPPFGAVGTLIPILLGCGLPCALLIFLEQRKVKTPHIIIIALFQLIVVVFEIILNSFQEGNHLASSSDVLYMGLILAFVTLVGSITLAEKIQYLIPEEWGIRVNMNTGISHINEPTVQQPVKEEFIKEEINKIESSSTTDNEITEFECSDCKHTVSANDNICPNCGAKF
jgi:hypothetical protein